MILCGMAVFNCILLWLSFRNIAIPEHHEGDDDEAEEATVENGSGVVEVKKPVQKRGIFAQVVRLKYTWIVAIFLVFYVGIETTIGSWGYTFLTVARNGDAVQMGRVCSLFFMVGWSPPFPLSFDVFPWLTLSTLLSGHVRLLGEWNCRLYVRGEGL
jgi:fucose permease